MGDDRSSRFEVEPSLAEHAVAEATSADCEDNSAAPRSLGRHTAESKAALCGATVFAGALATVAAAGRAYHRLRWGRRPA